MISKEDLSRKNFHWSEWFKSETAKELGVVNTVPPFDKSFILNNLMSTADMGQEIRDVLGCPVNVNSAYRCKALNDAVGSSDNSQHLKGLAIDLKADRFGNPEKIMRKLHSLNFTVDQCLCEGSWLHISRLNGKKSENRMVYAFYLLNPTTGERELKRLT